MKPFWRKRPGQSADEDVAADPSLPVIRLERVGKTFKGDGDEETLALAEITVDIGRGEYVSVSGPSGCGKSTYPLTLRGVPAGERKGRVDAALDRVGLAARAKQRPGSLSGGHQQLVAVARAITGRPAILLADEPTGNLDSKSGEALMQMFGELHAGGATVCLATHDPRWVTQAQRHIYLFDGRIVDCAPGDG